MINRIYGISIYLARHGLYSAVFLLLILAAVHTQPVYSEPVDERLLVKQMQAGGVILMIRHALAPGTGDPDHFQIGDCSTQRNLNDVGRTQAKLIGDWFRQRGIYKATVYSSQWCRCMETAKLLDLGSVTELPALNSFHGRPQDREPNLSALKTFLAGQDLKGKFLVFVTHQVTIAGITNEWTDSGHGKLVRLADDGRIELLGRLSFGTEFD